MPNRPRNPQVNQTTKTSQKSEHTPGGEKPLVEVPWYDQTPKNAPEKSGS